MKAYNAHFTAPAKVEYIEHQQAEISRIYVELQQREQLQEQRLHNLELMLQNSSNGSTYDAMAKKRKLAGAESSNGGS